MLVNFLKIGPRVGAAQYNVYDPFIWTKKSGMAPLPVPDGYNHVSGIALNNRGDVLLTASNRPSRDERGFLVRGGKLVELPDVPDAAATRYNDLNDRGWLVGRAVPKGHDPADRASWRGFVAKPVW